MMEPMDEGAIQWRVWEEIQQSLLTTKLSNLNSRHPQFLQTRKCIDAYLTLCYSLLAAPDSWSPGSTNSPKAHQETLLMGGRRAKTLESGPKLTVLNKLSKQAIIEVFQNPRPLE